MHICVVVYKNVLERLTVNNSISVQHNAVCCCVGYSTSTKTVDALLTLSLGGSSDIVTSIFAYKGGHSFYFGSKPTHSPLIMQDAVPEIVDALLTLNFRR